MEDQHWKGLTRVSSDPPSQLVKFNVIFIHGLRGHAKHTWEGGVPPSPIPQTRQLKISNLFRKSRDEAKEGSPAQTTKAAKVFWPRDLLVEDFPEAAIWTYGYNAAVIDGMFQASNQNNISQHGRDLAAALERDIDNEEPLVFIVHSLGGIITKDALRRSEKLQIRTRLVIFLGTPHRGSRHADWDQVIEKLALVTLQDSNTKVLSGLKVDSEVLDNIHDEFITLVGKRRIQVHSFQEAKGVPGLNGLVVNNFSSKLGLSSDVEKVETIDADHRQMARCSRREDEQYRKIVGEIKKRLREGLLLPTPASPPTSTSDVNASASSAPSIKPRHFLMPFALNKRFVGREEKLNELEQRLLIDQDCQRLAIIGLGGVGKTQLARSFCYTVKKQYPDFSIFWVSALSNATFRQSYADLAQLCSLSLGPNNPEPLLVVRKHLESPDSGKWLLVVDNADDAHLVRDKSSGIVNFLPSSSSGITLFTSRNKDLADVADHNILDLDKMSPVEGQAFLEKLLRKDDLIKNKVLLRELLEELEYLPLAIVQAGSCILKSSISIPKYLGILRSADQSMINLLNREFYDDTRDQSTKNAVAATWLISFRQIEELEPGAASLLTFIGCIEQKAIPRSILPQMGTEEALVHDIGVLTGYSFLTLVAEEENDDLYDMHRLVHRAVGIWLRMENTVEPQQRRVIQHLSSIFPRNTEWKLRFVWQKYTPHAIKILTDTSLMECEARANLCLYLGCCLIADSRVSEAARWLTQCVIWRDQSLSETDSNRLYARYRLASAYRRTKKEAKAIDILKEITSTQPNRIHKLIYSFELGEVYLWSGQVEEAVKTLAQVVSTACVIFKEGAELRLLGQVRLAQAYLLAGRITEAIDLAERVASFYAKSSSEDDLGSLTARLTLAGAYYYAGRRDEATAIMREVVLISDNVLTKQHADRRYFRQVLDGMLNGVEARLLHQYDYEYRWDLERHG